MPNCKATPSREQLEDLILAILPTPPDFELLNNGSISLLYPLTDRAKEWMNEHLPVDDPGTQFWGDAILIEHRYVLPIMQGIVAEGLVLR